MKKSICLVAVGLFVFVGAFFVGTGSAAAQDLRLGYQFQRLMFGECEGDDCSENLNAGISGEVGFPFGSRGIAGVVEVDWSHKSEGGESFNLTNFGGGIRWTAMTMGRVSPFLEGLIGVAHPSSGSDSENDFSFGFDGGITAPIKGSVDLLVQAGYRRISAEDQGVNAFRMIFGIRCNLKK